MRKREKDRKTAREKEIERGIKRGSPVFKPDQAEVVHLDDPQPLADRVEDELDAVLGQLDDQVVGEGLLVAVGDLDPLDDAHLGLDRGHGRAKVHA